MISESEQYKDSWELMFFCVLEEDLLLENTLLFISLRYYSFKLLSLEFVHLKNRQN